MSNNIEWKKSEIDYSKLNELTHSKLVSAEIGKYTKSKKIGIHTDNEELRTKWATMGGEASIQQLLQWQEENGFRVCDLERTSEWKEAISKAHMGKVITEETKKKLSKAVKKLNKSLTKEERSKMYSNDARKNAATKRKIDILNTIKKKQFTSKELKDACVKFDYDYKLMIKDTNLLERIHQGKNQTDLSIYKKIF